VPPLHRTYARSQNAEVVQFRSRFWYLQISWNFAERALFTIALGSE
jgi:hypothetical protein